MTTVRPRLFGLYLFVADLAATKKFYSALGLSIEEVSDVFARASWDGEVYFEFGTSALTLSYDPKFESPGRLSKATFNFEFVSRTAVDEKYNELISAGYVGHLAPCDPPWRARFAIVEDPDGNFIGLHSPRSLDEDRRQERLHS
ncbi:MAG: VOC family protein [Pseudomonadota bacterium]